MATRQIRGCEIAYERSGSGPDLMWGHGLTQSRELENRLALVDWSSIPATVVRYDARGHGSSDSTPDLDGYSWAELARDQLALASEVGVDTYIAGGASMGAATALHAAVSAPERIRGLVLAIPPTGWEARSGQADVYEQGAQALEAFGVEPLIKAGALVAPPLRSSTTRTIDFGAPTGCAHGIRSASRRRCEVRPAPNSPIETRSQRSAVRR